MVEVHHVEGKVVNILRDVSRTRTDLVEFKRRYDATFVNEFIPEGEGMRYTLGASVRLKWPYRLGALQDKQIGRIISLIHRDPARPWTLESLAASAAMSRSAFAARFTELVGEPAMHYVTRWRMHAALALLKENNTSVSEVSHRLGYESEAAFSRAFKRYIGLSPGVARRNRA